MPMPSMKVRRIAAVTANWTPIKLPRRRAYRTSYDRPQNPETTRSVMRTRAFIS
jgi:hypothetical protein